MARTTNIILRVSPEEKKAIELGAKDLELNTSQFIRSAALEWASQKQESQPSDPPFELMASKGTGKVKPIGVLEAHERAGKAIINSGKKQPTQKDANKLAMQLLADGKAKTMKEARDKAAKKLGLNGS